MDLSVPSSGEQLVIMISQLFSGQQFDPTCQLEKFAVKAETVFFNLMMFP
jgi:hypothetical protein